MSEAVIKASNISKLYKLYDRPGDRFKETFSLSKKSYHKEFYALKDINFTINKGETIGIIGRNGSGKSTLLKILTGVLNPSEGNIEVNGKISALLELGAGFNMEYTGMENIYLNGTIMGIPRKEMEKKVQDILDFAEIGDFIYQPVKSYSSGMFVRLAFAVAINVEPEILIVDEALAVGDTRFQLKCMDKFVEFMEAGKTVLFVSHDINSIKRFCKRCIWINQGKLIMDGETDEVSDRYMDFLKYECSIEEYLAQVENSKKEAMELAKKAEENKEEPVEENVTEQDIDKVDLGEIYDMRLFNSEGKEINDITHGEDVTIKIRYIVNVLNVDNPVLGVAIRTVDNKYICGLNTLLDNHTISWKRGMNEVTLTYKKFNLTGGNYFFDVALFDRTATVQIDYRSQFKTFFVKMNYIAEGVVVLNHTWN